MNLRRAVLPLISLIAVAYVAAHSPALAWIGRGTYTADDWDEAVEVAGDEHVKNAARYLLGQPLLADELEQGLDELGLSCEDVDT